MDPSEKPRTKRDMKTERAIRDMIHQVHQLKRGKLSSLKLDNLNLDNLSIYTESPRKPIEYYLEDLLPTEQLYRYALKIYEKLNSGIWRYRNLWNGSFVKNKKNKIKISPKQKNQGFHSIEIIFGDLKVGDSNVSGVCKKIGINNDSPYFNELYAKILKEIVLQIYAEKLTYRHSYAKVPKIYGVSKREKDGVTFISIFMEFLEKVEIDSKEFGKWARRIPDILENFADHGLYHLDTAHRNVYFTTEGKLAIIDFGEAKNINNIPREERGFIFEEGQSTGYPVKPISDETTDEGMFENWINGRYTSNFGTYGGTRRKRRASRFSKKIYSD